MDCNPLDPTLTSTVHFKMWQPKFIFGTLHCKNIILVCLTTISLINHPKTVYNYEPVQVITLIWVQQRCKSSSLLIWVWWYPKPRLKQRILFCAIEWCMLFVMVVCHFLLQKVFYVNKRWRKAFFGSSETALANIRKSILP